MLQLKNSQDILVVKGHLFHSNLSFISLLRYVFFITIAQLLIISASKIM